MVLIFILDSLALFSIELLVINGRLLVLLVFTHLKWQYKVFATIKIQLWGTILYM